MNDTALNSAFAKFVNDAENAAYNDCKKVSSCASRFYFGTLLPRVKVQVQAANLDAHTIQRKTIEEYTRCCKDELAFNKKFATDDDCLNLTVNLLMLYVTRLCIEDGANVVIEKDDSTTLKSIRIDFIKQANTTYLTGKEVQDAIFQLRQDWLNFPSVG